MPRQVTRSGPPGLHDPLGPPTAVSGPKQAKNGARSVPFKTLKTLKDGSELVPLRESSAMLSRRRRDIGGFAKAMWVIFVVILPWLGVLV